MVFDAVRLISKNRGFLSGINIVHSLAKSGLTGRIAACRASCAVNMPGRTYHVLSRGNRREDIFIVHPRPVTLEPRYLSLYRKVSVNDNHRHWNRRTDSEADLEHQVQRGCAKDNAED